MPMERRQGQGLLCICVFCPWSGDRDRGCSENIHATLPPKKRMEGRLDVRECDCEGGAQTAWTSRGRETGSRELRVEKEAQPC